MKNVFFILSFLTLIFCSSCTEDTLMTMQDLLQGEWDITSAKYDGLESNLPDATYSFIFTSSSEDSGNYIYRTCTVENGVEDCIDIEDEYTLTEEGFVIELKDLSTGTLSIVGNLLNINNPEEWSFVANKK